MHINSSTTKRTVETESFSSVIDDVRRRLLLLSPVVNYTTMKTNPVWRWPFTRGRNSSSVFVCLLIMVTLSSCGSAYGDKVLPDLSKIPTPPSFFHEPNPTVMYFDVESTGGMVISSANDTNGGHLKERKMLCRATGYPTVEYRWLKNGEPFNLHEDNLSQRVSRIPGEGSFLFSSLTGADEGTYQCVAQNGNGTAYDRPIEFKRTLIDLFTSPRVETIEVKFGDPYSKECIPPRSVPSARTYWILMSGPSAERRMFQTINFTNVAVNDKGTIYFQYVTDDDNHQGYYFTCMAENLALKDYKFGNQFNFKVTKTVKEQKLGPLIAPTEQYTSPSTITVLRGGSLELHCIFSGYPDQIPKWSKRMGGGKNEVVRGSYGTNFQKSIKIDNVTENDAGIYDCKFERSFHIDKNFTVIVESAPFWRKEKQRNVNSSEGSEVEFFCDVIGEPTPTVSFYKNGEPITVDDRISVDGNRMIIKDLRKGENGTGDNAVYQCKATNKHGFLWQNFYLNILAFAPMIVEQPGTIETVVGKDVSLKCKVFGSPSPVAKWTSKNPSMSGHEGYHFDILPVNYDGWTELRLKDVKMASSDDYECFFSNKYGETSASGKLVVRKATIITTEPKNKNVTSGTRVELECEAKSDENLSVQYSWYANGDLVSNSDRIAVDPETNSLIIYSPSGEDTGEYKCIAQTELDKTERTVQITVKDVPLSPYNVHVTCSSNTAAEVTFYYTDRMPITVAPATRWIIQMNVDPREPDAWDNYVVDMSNIGGLPQSAADTGVVMQYGQGKANVHLYPYGNFAFRVLARNDVGLSPPAYPSKFINDQGTGRCQTKAQAPERNPGNVYVKPNIADTLEVHWDPTPRRDWYGPDFGYVVQYKKSKEENEPYNNHTVDDPYQSSAVIPNVQSYSDYDVLVWSKNKEGLPGVRPASVQGRSGESLPTAAPTGFKLKSTEGPSSATFYWVPVDPETVNGQFKGYKVQHWYQTTKRAEPTVREAFFDAEAREGTIYDLKPNKQNWARIMVYNNAGDGPASEDIPFQMPEGVPTPVQDLIARPVSHSEIGVWWKPPREINGNLTRYDVKVCSVSESPFNQTCVLTRVDPQAWTETRVSGLKPDTKYTVEVYGATEAGDGDPNWVETTTTVQIVEPLHPIVPSLDNVQIGKDHINITHKPGIYSQDDARPPGSKFYVKYRPKDNAEWQVVNDTSGTSFTISLKDLKPGTTYHVRSVAVHNGLETESGDYQFTTAGGSAYSSTAGWLIAIIVAIIILIIILIIVCLVVRNRGAKYAVSEKEKEQGREPMLKEEKGFGEYARPEVEEEKKSLTAESTKRSESETDSMAEYGEGEGGRFTEDGSFIGIYGKQPGSEKPKQTNNSSTVV